MVLRWLTGLTVAGVVGLAAWVGSVWWFGLIMLFLAVAAQEWANMAGASVPLTVVTLLAAALVLMVRREEYLAVLPMVLLVPAGGMLWRQSPGDARDIVWSAAGIIWMVLPAVLLVMLRRELGFMVLLVLLAGTVAQDTFAYYAGRWFGGDRPFTPVISPNKTWAGFVGSLVGMTGVFLVAGHIRHWPLGGTLTAGVGLGLIGQAGDLSMSGVKRWAEVEDTGVVFPGHGGILDRVDGLVFNVAAFYPVAFWLEGVL